MCCQRQTGQAGGEAPEDCEWGRLIDRAPGARRALEGAAELRNQVGGRDDAIPCVPMGAAGHSGHPENKVTKLEEALGPSGRWLGRVWAQGLMALSFPPPLGLLQVWQGLPWSSLLSLAAAWPLPRSWHTPVNTSVYCLPWARDRAGTKWAAVSLASSGMLDVGLPSP